MKARVLQAAILIFGLVSVSNAQKVVTLQEGLDGYAGTTDSYMEDTQALGAYTLHNYPKLNRGNEPRLGVAWQNIDSSCPYANYAARALIRFELSDLVIPEGAYILSASLKLYAAKSHSTNYTTLAFPTGEKTNKPNGLKQLAPAHMPWVEKYVTWVRYGYEINDGFNTPLGYPRIENDNTSFGVWETYDVSSTVIYFTQFPEENYGFELKMDKYGFGTSVEYPSSEYMEDPSLRPKLEITFAKFDGSEFEEGPTSIVAENKSLYAPSKISITDEFVQFNSTLNQFSEVKLFNLNGKEIATLFSGVANEGVNNIPRTSFANQIESGEYLISLRQNGTTKFQKFHNIH